MAFCSHCTFWLYAVSPFGVSYLWKKCRDLTFLPILNYFTMTENLLFFNNALQDGGTICIHQIKVLVSLFASWTAFLIFCKGYLRVTVCTTLHILHFSCFSKGGSYLQMHNPNSAVKSHGLSTSV